MPLTEEQKEALKTLTAADAKDVADAMQSEAQGHYQAIYQRGFSTAHNESKTKLDEKDGELAKAREEVKETEQEIQKLREKAPDAEAIRQEYEEKLTAKEREKKEALEAAESRVKSVHQTRFEAELAASLIEAGIEPDYAREVLVPKHRGRIKVDIAKTDDGEEIVRTKFYDDDGSTPLDAANGELTKVAAESIKGKVDPKWITSKVDSGGGSNGNGASGGKNDWDKVREKAKARHATSGPDSESIQKRREALLGAA